MGFGYRVVLIFRMQPRITVCLLLKAPLLGTVKTRLAAGVGAEDALRIYRRLAEHQLNELPSEWKVEVHFTPATEERLMRTWLAREHVEFFAQPEGDLGVRLETAQLGAFRRGAEVVILLGGDCPELHCHRLREAEISLRDHDVVIAPASDGGYALLGTTKPQPKLFWKIPWSTAAVFSETIRRAEEQHLRVATLDLVSDIDEIGDWERLKHLLA